MRTSACLSLFLLSWLTLSGCSNTRIVEKPVPVEVVRVEVVPIPAELLHVEHKQSIPDQITYGQAIELWSEDRATIDILNGRLDAIRILE